MLFNGGGDKWKFYVSIAQFFEQNVLSHQLADG